MAKRYLFCVVWAAALVGVTVGADDLSDFSNNLATDIGPLLALFGESMTRQYLSESTSFLDYFIFAMAPIGILTAIVSTIRVCGHSSLRAFIGRSQEGDGVVEAELCTSTSRDVCELFNRGGITRVLGRPKIIELVYDAGYNTPPPGYVDDKAGLFLFQHYLQKYANSNGETLGSDWRRVKRRANSSDQGTTHSSFATHPNISLNVGIVKRPDWVFNTVAAIGFVLQAGVITLAGAGVWILRWDLNEGDGPAATINYAPSMYIIGTALMCGGMWSCAALIGQTTREVRFERVSRDQAAHSQSRLIWLQPGPQLIGDQSFDPFAHIEDTTKPLRMWTSSKKEDWDKVSHFELYTFVAVLAVVIGYIIQFIGLRGMKAWISLTQLGITIVMSLLRGSLRMQRLDRKGNKLLDMPDTVAGHELDWLAFELREHHEVYDPASTHPPGASQAGQRQAKLEDLIRTRVRLAHLTGHVSLGKLEDREYQLWEHGTIKVRAKAFKLAEAFRRIAETLLPKSMPYDTITLQVKVVDSPTADDEAGDREQLVPVILKPPQGKKMQTRWAIDSARVEAILGLWMWSLTSNERLDNPNATAKEKGHETVRVVSVGPDDHNWRRDLDRQGDMNFWLGSGTPTFTDATIDAVEGCYNHNLVDLFFLDSGDRWILRQHKQERRPLQSFQRLCGWDLVRESQSRQFGQQVGLRVQTCPIDGSLLDICAQELFVALVVALVVQNLVPLGSTTFVEDDGNVRFDNPAVSALATAFAESGLGTRSDALLCIIPALRNRLQMPSEKEMLTTSIRQAEAYRRQSEWERAETLLQWACQRHPLSTPAQDGDGSDDDDDLPAKAFRAIGELYRWALAQASDGVTQKFGRDGISWMRDQFSSTGEEGNQGTEILDCYQTIEKKIDQLRPSNVPPRPEIFKQLARATHDRDRTEALYLLCLVKTGDFKSPVLQPALPQAVRNGWHEVASAMLEMKADPNKMDDDGRTALTYCAELGFDIERYLDHGAFADLPDGQEHTPLLYAAKHGHRAIVDRLLEEDVETRNKKSSGQTPLVWATEGGHSSVVDLLLERGANIDAKDKEGFPALLVAARDGHKSVVDVLLKR
ncbi:uncharacterized protein B0H64DRAFT_354020, partial [Chaetomium fimeti]